MPKTCYTPNCEGMKRKDTSTHTSTSTTGYSCAIRNPTMPGPQPRSRTRIFGPRGREEDEEDSGRKSRTTTPSTGTIRFRNSAYAMVVTCTSAHCRCGSCVALLCVAQQTHHLFEKGVGEPRPPFAVIIAAASEIDSLFIDEALELAPLKSIHVQWGHGVGRSSSRGHVALQIYNEMVRSKADEIEGRRGTIEDFGTRCQLLTTYIHTYNFDVQIAKQDFDEIFCDCEFECSGPPAEPVTDSQSVKIISPKEGKTGKSRQKFYV